MIHLKCYRQLKKYRDDTVEYYHCPVCRRSQCSILPLLQLYSNPLYRKNLSSSWTPEMKEKCELSSILVDCVNHELLTQMHSSVLETESVFFIFNSY